MESTISVTTPRVAWSVTEVATSTGLSRGFLRSEIKRGRLRPDASAGESSF